jgi:hypothetical protein
VVRALLLVAGLTGCDLIFQPGSRGLDAPASSDGPGRDGPEIFDANGDASGDAEVVDGTPQDAACTLNTCNAPDLVAGTPNTGTAGCAPSGSCPAFPALNSVDLCSCTAGQPELYAIRAGTFAAIGLVAPEPSNGEFSLNRDGGACLAGPAMCLADTCPGGTALWVWDAVPIAVGGLNTIAIYDGPSCMSPPAYTFSVVIP